MSLDNIIRPIKKDIDSFNIYFKESIKNNIFLVDKVTNYILKTKGKQIRPILVFLSSGLSGKCVLQASYRMATLIELLHTATLLHDDVVDEAYMRRGNFSINALWKNKISVLIGDYLLAKGLMLSIDNKDYEFLGMVSDTVKQMSEGEILQIEKSRKLNIDEDIYFEIIKKKTAVLFATCCSGGALASGCDRKLVNYMYDVGLNLGIIFQIKDDLLDFESKNTGKNKGSDLKENKLTLPVIHLLNSLSLKDRYLLKRDIKINGNKNINEIIKKMEIHGSIEYSYKKINDYKQYILELLCNFDDSIYKDSILNLIDYTIQRNK
ncbi:MAG: hypothetical protein A2X12_01100 [Bacteroidetes bacterium GWE2_29_8]|nr:MAG: hypothetical protein A2X12_01100 [Bacteroidetes bacterium GWE2_29_8]OFY14410.1 MAG: hypothetical protein A2X02_01235 [Bacteroidetes bacterium GWF2_29_10]